MSSTLIKTLKIAVASVLSLCIAMGFCACGNTVENLDEADQICVSGSYTESWMYVFADETFVTEMAEIFSSVKVKKAEEPVDMMTAQKVLSITFSNGNETIAKFIVDSDNRLCFEAGTQPYLIKSEFDFSYVKSLVDEQIKAVNSDFNATPDEA